MEFRFRYCPNCGKPIGEKNKTLVDCPHCGFHFYLSPASTNAVIIENDKGEILLTKRKSDPRKGYWDTPGGFVNLGETVEDSVRREIREELGYEIEDFKYFGSYWSYYPYKGFTYQTLCHVFTAKYNGEKIIAGDDAEETRFFPKDKIPFAELSFKDISDGIRDYISGQRT